MKAIISVFALFFILMTGTSLIAYIWAPELMEAEDLIKPTATLLGLLGICLLSRFILTCQKVSEKDRVTE